MPLALAGRGEVGEEDQPMALRAGGGGSGGGGAAGSYSTESLDLLNRQLKLYLANY